MEVDPFHQLFLDSLKSPLAVLLDLPSEALNSYFMDQSSIQDSFWYRAKYLGLKIASLLIDEKGELDVERLKGINTLLDGGCFVLGPGRESDALIYRHLQDCLRKLAESKEIWVAIRRFSTPLCHKKADQVIKESLWPEPIRTVQTVHVRKAVLAAWLTLLRQSTGSCFATAPAILIQQNYPIKFFKDLYDLLSTGQIKRRMAGKEYSVPLSFHSGAGDLQKIALGLESSPGLVIALGAVGIEVSEAIQQKCRELSLQTVEKVLRAILLEEAGLTEEEILDEEHLARIQMTPLLARQSAVYYQKPSARAQKVSEWKKKFAVACLSFRTMTECALLQSWEYSIASFSDVKTEFARWNLYIGLGLHPDQKGGIGAFLYAQVNARFQACRQKIEQLGREYEQAASAIQALESMIQGASSYDRINQFKAELAAHSLSIQSIIEMRNQLIAQSDALAGLFASLIEQYDEKLQHSFQELFDPALIGEEAHLYDDSSAGFRLVYKHGRADASQWTGIYSGEQYVDCLREFFANTENDLLISPQLERGLLSEIITALIQFIQEPAFLASALLRAKEKGRKSPWDYISGGTLQTLLLAYCNRDRPFTESSLVPHSEEELLRFLERSKKGTHLLMHSPTHAFIFYPTLLSNQLVRPKPVKWDEGMQEHIAHVLSERLPFEEKALFIHLFRQKTTAESNLQFRINLIDALGPRIKSKEALVDSVFYENTPLFSQPQAKDALNLVLRSLNLHETVSQLEGSFFGPFQIYQLAKRVILQSRKEAISSVDWDQKIAEVMRRLGFCQSPLLFADTNWPRWFFGFVFNPATQHMELWRLNRTATQGFPMYDWKQWTDAANTLPWIVLSEPKEYLIEFEF